MRTALVLLSLLLAGCPSIRRREASPLAGARQLVAVRAAGWDAPVATLQRFVREGSGWTAAGPAVPVSLGKAGLGWGRGLSAPGESGPVKQEGDLRAPAGVFPLGPAFGEPAAPPEGTRLPYRAMTAGDLCIDDDRSAHYNRFVDARATARDWQSAEQMHRDDALYRYGIVVQQNDAPPVPKGGSCVFLHIWRGAGSPTAGCTAMEETSLVALLRWLDPAQTPLLVQLPEAEYARLRVPWGLP